MTWAVQLIHDLRWLNEEELSKKYCDKIPVGTTIQKIVDIILNSKELPSFLVTDWEKAKDEWHHGVFIEMTQDGKYLIFDWERRIKHPLRSYSNFNEAVSMFIQLRLNDFHYSAPDEDRSIYA